MLTNIHSYCLNRESLLKMVNQPYYVVDHALSNEPQMNRVQWVAQKRDFAVFARQRSAAVSLCETSRGKVVATSFLYLTVNKKIVGDVPMYPKFALKVTHPFRKWQF